MNACLFCCVIFFIVSPFLIHGGVSLSARQVIEAQARAILAAKHEHEYHQGSRRGVDAWANIGEAFY